MVCTGNICRSPMMERIAAAKAHQAGLDVEVTSGGTSNEESGNPIDHRARRVLERAGYDAGNHHATKVTASDLAEADLVVAAEEHHRRALLRVDPRADVRLLSEFDPDLPVDASDFDETLVSVEAAMPGLIAYLQTRTS